MQSLKESDKSILQLQVYLDKDAICLRSYVDGEIPYFEVDTPYDNKANVFLDALTDEEMDERLSPLFYGIPQELMKSKIMCTINDCRTPLETCRTFVFKRKNQDSNQKFAIHSNENQNFNL